MADREIIIRPLSPELCEDWLGYFDGIAFSDHGDWAFCYCLEGHLTPKQQDEWSDPRERREKAAQLIRSGEMQGYLAYLDGKVVGWCNANDRENYLYLAEMFKEIGYHPQSETGSARVKAVFCFLVAPEHRGKGIAQNLLKRVCDDAARDGYGYVEAYPFCDDDFEFQYHGTAGMYLRSGFSGVADLKYVKVMRRKLS